ncbi:DHH family phosphoesterase [Radiobacillus sp. PE A8.2]|uniref:DHH family phosphoesterase n=1 Tax=Radiobacillus sp. PE A8.2 TaxID=3380349 RepID=UPI00388F8C2E
MSYQQAIIEKIKQYQTIIIHRHVRPDPDAYGSQAGLAEIIMSSFPEKKIHIVGDEDVSLAYLTKMDTIEDSVYRDALVIICDTANQARIADQRYMNGKEIIKIDHHPSVDPYGDIAWVDPTASSTSEMIYELYLHGKADGLLCNKVAAELLYCGIVGDTGRFLFPSTTDKTFRYVADLVAYDFDRTTLYDNMYHTKMNMARLKGYILQNFDISSAGVCSIKLSKKLLQEYRLSSSETSQLIGVFGDVEGIKAWVFFVEEDDLIRVRLRSKGPVINDVAAKYNGGGHPLASGATIYSWEEAKQLIHDLEEVCQ